ncbi:MAG TPA: hypothetical protein VGI65_13870 [Steroidobacteraceae bacterium]|jgi:hypothetical protein
MRKILGLLLLLPAFAPADSPGVYQPLAFLADHCWKGTFPGGAGQTDEHCFSWIYGGKFLRDRHTVRAPGKPDALGESIYFWNSSAKQLEYLYIESDGGFSRGALATDQDSLVFPDSSFVEEGKTVVYRSRWQRSGSNAYDVPTEFQGANGWVPGFKIHMERTETR